MENKSYLQIKTCATKTSRRYLAMILACVMIFSLTACGGQKTVGPEKIKPVTVEREPEPVALQTVSEATAVALRQYIYARLLTEELAAADFKTMSMEEIKKMIEKTALAWEETELFAYSAEDIADSALMLMEDYATKPTAANDKLQVKFMTLAATPLSFSLTAYAAGSAKEFDAKAWADSLTKQYDVLKGAKRYQQLAQQLGTDAKSAYEQMTLAQEIIRGQATADAAFWDKLTKAAQATKTASKVGLLGLSMVATGGGSVALLEGAGLLVGGVDCIVDVTETGSTILLGDNNQVAVAFGDIKEKLGPVSSLIGLATLNPSGVGKAAKDTTEALVYITDSLVDLFYEDKIVGIKVEGLSNQAVAISSEIFEAGAKTALEAAGFLFPETTKALSQLAGFWEPEPEVMIARMDALVSQMAELERVTDITEEGSPEPGGSGSAPSISEDINIFGKYTVISKTEDEAVTDTVILRDNGNGTLLWISEEGDETYLSYDPTTNIIHTESEGLTVHIEFSLSGNTVIGSGYESGTFWGESVEATITLTKISD
jgi:hypothetical protein